MAQRLRYTERAFTLTEIAIMLSVVGLVLAGLWAAGSTVWKNYQADKALQQVTTVVQNIREYYSASGIIRNAAGTAPACAGVGETEITNILDDPSRRIFPADMMVAPDANDEPINHAMASTAAGSVHVYCMRNGTAFRVELSGFTQPDCIRFALGYPVLDPQQRVERFRVNTSSATVNTQSINAPGTGMALPLTITSAQTVCNGTSNLIRIEYPL